MMKRYPILSFRQKYPTAHRPWPLPEKPWVGRQTWADLLFAHWRVRGEQVRHLVPAGLNIQQFDGSSWIHENDMFEPHGVKVTGPPIVHFARCLDVVVWPPEKCGP